jgi:hypothetical protein
MKKIKIMITESHFDKQKAINENIITERKYFVIIKTDPVIESYKITELKEYLWPFYKFITYKGIFPLVEYINISGHISGHIS